MKKMIITITLMMFILGGIVTAYTGTESSSDTSELAMLATGQEQEPSDSIDIIVLGLATLAFVLLIRKIKGDKK